MKNTIKIVLIIITSLFFYGNVYAADNTENETKAYFSAEVTRGYKNGDCILLENSDEEGNKLYGMIDTGRNLEKNDEQGNKSTVVKEFLKRHNVEELQFIILTHSHLDHNEGTTEVINNFKVNKIYMKEFDKKWALDGRQDYYEAIVKKAIEKQIPIIGVSYESLISNKISPSRSEEFKQIIKNAKKELFESFNESNINIRFGSSILEIYNWEIFDENGNQIITEENNNSTREIDEHENNNSLGILLTQGNKKAFFAGDINNLDEDKKKERIGDEDRIKNQVGKVDLLKLGHHGYKYSNTKNFMNTLRPQYAIITNDIGEAYLETIKLLETKKVEYLYTTSDKYGIVATIKNDEISLGFETEGIKNVNGVSFYIQEPYKDFTKVGFEYNPIKSEDIKINGKIDTWTNTEQEIEIVIENYYRSLKINGQEVEAKDGKYIMSVDETNSYNIEVDRVEGGSIVKNINVEIDKVPPTIDGIEDEVKYSEDVMFDINDDNSGISSIKIAKNGVKKEFTDTQLKLSKNGNYDVEVTDNAGNITTRTFSIEKATDTTTDDTEEIEEEKTQKHIFSTKETTENNKVSAKQSISNGKSEVVLPHTGLQKVTWGIVLGIVVLSIIFNVKSKKIGKQIKKG